jgi:hypothetical protein
MNEIQFFNYECFITSLSTGQKAMVQIFRNPQTNEVIHVQLAFKSPAYGTWGIPYQMDVAK